MAPGTIQWVYAFVDRPKDWFAQAHAFWAAVTGTRLSAFRGEDEQFVTLLPDGADAILKAQAVGGPGGAHLDFAVDDVVAKAGEARALGATPVFAEEGLEVLRSPGGQLFCVVKWQGERVRPVPLAQADGTTSRLDQVCLDVPPAVFEAEKAFWPAFTGWSDRPGSRPEFHLVEPDPRLPMRILLQRLDDDGSAGAHLDFSCSDLDADRVRHERLGAETVWRGPHWIVMRDPAGGTYCLTIRNPETGGLPDAR
ncbi:VOC family protein [Streptomyces sp. NBC_01283]|uniref:VOC family protein n=1 Tax=Streptomyces sp. NBC_01283 TaxID=2903812 RepID=UPI00352C1974|nr:VOC family protein [Streptomyces sp. NBC_01283]